MPSTSQILPVSWRTKFALLVVALVSLPVGAQTKTPESVVKITKIAELGDMEKTCDAVLAIRSSNMEKLKSCSLFWENVEDQNWGSDFGKEFFKPGSHIGGLYSLSAQDGKVVATEKIRTADGSTDGQKRVYDGENWFTFDLEMKPDGRIGVTDKKLHQLHGHANWFQVIQWTTKLGSGVCAHSTLNIERYRDFKSAKLTACDVENHLCRMRVEYSKTKQTETFTFDLAKNGCLVESSTLGPDGTVYLRKTQKVEEVAKGLWMPTKVEMEIFDQRNGELIVGRVNKLDLEKCVFNKPVADKEFEVQIKPTMEILDHRFKTTMTYSGRSSILPRDIAE